MIPHVSRLPLTTMPLHLAPERNVILFQKIAAIAIRCFIPLSLVFSQKDLILQIGAGIGLSLPLVYLFVKYKCAKPQPLLDLNRCTAPAA